MKKLLMVMALTTITLTSAMTLTGCNNSKPAGNSDFKVGVVLVGDETEGYTLAHINGIKEAQKALGLRDDQIVYKRKVEENDKCAEAVEDLVSSDCSLIISNSYGHQDYMYNIAKENPDVTFVASTGDYAAISGLKNYKNAFTKIYESRYVSGVVAGLKLKELVDNGTLTETSSHFVDGNWKIGYVGAYKYAEVISGYTAFYLGVKSIVSNVTMDVQFTNSWFNVDKESAAANTLVQDDKCVIIGQHADSTGAPSKCESLLKAGNICYSIGYNVDMLEKAPTAALTSATNNWGAYYTYAFKQAMDGKEIVTDWAEGYTTNAVGITALGKSAAAGTQEKVAEVEGKIKNGSLKVFDTSTFTVKKEKVTTNVFDFSAFDFSTGKPVVVHQGEKKETIKTEGSTSYFDESSLRSAPYFDLNIDGINWLN